MTNVRVYVNRVFRSYSSTKEATKAYKKAVAGAILMGLDDYQVSLVDGYTGEILKSTYFGGDNDEKDLEVLLEPATPNNDVKEALDMLYDTDNFGD